MRCSFAAEFVTLCCGCVVQVIDRVRPDRVAVYNCDSTQNYLILQSTLTGICVQEELELSHIACLTS